MLLPALIKLHQRRIPLLRLEHRRIHHQHRNRFHGLGHAVVVGNSVVAAGQLDKRVAYFVHFRRVAVHAAQELALEHVDDDLGARVPVRRRPPAGRVVDLEPDGRLARRVAELVVVEDPEGLARPARILAARGSVVFEMRVVKSDVLLTLWRLRCRMPWCCETGGEGSGGWVWRRDFVILDHEFGKTTNGLFSIHSILALYTNSGRSSPRRRSAAMS